MGAAYKDHLIVRDSAAMQFLFAGTFLCVVHIALVYPGIMTWDSQFQFEQATTNVVNDWFPPIMVRLWQLLLPISNSGSAILILHLAIYWLSFTLVAFVLRKKGHQLAALATMIVGTLPHTVLLSSFLLKDVGFSVCTCFAFAILFFSRIVAPANRLYVIVPFIIVLSYATLVRTNGIFGTAPLIVYALTRKLSGHRNRLFLVTAASVVLALVILPISQFVNVKLLAAKPTNPVLSLIEYDLAGIAHFSRDASVYPDRDVTIGIVDQCYTARFWDPLFGQACKPKLGLGSSHSNKIRANAWVRAIVSHPAAYARHRIAHFNEETFAFVSRRDWTWSIYSKPGLPIPPAGRIENFTKDVLNIFTNSPVLAPFVFYTASLSILGLISFKKRLNDIHEACFYITVSGVLYTSAFLVIGIASMYRYQQLLMMTTLIGGILLLAGYRPTERLKCGLIVAGPTLFAIAAVGFSRSMF